MTGPVLVLILWDYGAKHIDNRLILPRLSSVAGNFLAPTENMIGLGSLIVNILISVIRVLIGYTIAIIIAVPSGI